MKDFEYIGELGPRGTHLGTRAVDDRTFYLNCMVDPRPDRRLPQSPVVAATKRHQIFYLRRPDCRDMSEKGVCV